jgi:hypothetical protein
MIFLPKKREVSTLVFVFVSALASALVSALVSVFCRDRMFVFVGVGSFTTTDYVLELAELGMYYGFFCFSSALIDAALVETWTKRLAPTFILALALTLTHLTNQS